MKLLLADAEKDLIKELNSLEFGTDWNVERIDKQLRSVQTIISESYALMNTDLVSELSTNKIGKNSRLKPR